MPVDHYENFPVASWLLPPRLRRAVVAIYRFARSADDIADEGNAPTSERLKALDTYRVALDRIATGSDGGNDGNGDRCNSAATTSLFRELAAAVREHDLPIPLLHDLLDAFTQDLTQTRYKSFDDLLDYCRRSANPVGRLLLRLYRAETPQQLVWSDAICTSLQLINHWQDIGIDWTKQRVYLPQEDLRRFGIEEAQIAAGLIDDNWRALMRFEVDRARALMLEGAPLGRSLPGRIGLELRLIVAGGLRILDKIEAADYDVFNRRPVLRALDWPCLMWHATMTATRHDAMNPDEYCRQRAAESGSSFYYSFRFLPAPRRQAITAFYAFCREIDDVVDECSDAQVARIKLAWWRGEIDALQEGRPIHPVTRALAISRQRFDLPRELLLEIIDGMEMDLDQMRYADFKALHLYCYRVASVVGLIAAEIFGYTDRHTLKYAHDLGLAFQLTNIIRDVGEDARRGRVYLPLDDLARFDVPIEDILHARYSDNFRCLMEFQIARAERMYEQAMAQLPACDRKAQRPGLIMAAIYRELLDTIKHDGCHVLDHRTALSPLRKIWLAWRTYVREA